MKFNEIVSFIADDPHFYFENISCPYCDTEIGTVFESEYQCGVCSQIFQINTKGIPVEYADPLQRIPLRNSIKLFLKEDISNVAQGRPGWKSVVSTYHDGLTSDTFDIFWSMVGSNVLFKNGERVDLQAAARETMAGDPSNKKKYTYDPRMEKIESVIDIKSLINKYNLDSAGYSVNSFSISPDGSKVFSGAPVDAFDTSDSKPFFNALTRCIALKNEMAQHYQPDPDLDDERLQMAINNFISDNPLILSLPTGNITPDEVGHYSDFISNGERMEEALDSSIIIEKTSHIDYEEIENLGYTDNWRDTGWILPDGRMIDMSYGQGNRVEDHRIIGGIAGMQELMNEGAIRFMPENMSFNMMRKPTNAQYEKLENIFNDSDKTVQVELEPGLGAWDERRGYYIEDTLKHFYKEYEVYDSFQQIRYDIDRYYDNQNIGYVEDPAVENYCIITGKQPYDVEIFDTVGDYYIILDITDGYDQYAVTDSEGKPLEYFDDADRAVDYINENPLTEEWTGKFQPNPDGRGFVDGEDWTPKWGKNTVIDYDDPIWTFRKNGEIIPVYGSNHTVYRMQHQRNAANQIIDLDSPYLITTNNIDRYVGDFVNYFEDIFKPQISQVGENERITFLYKQNRYMHPLSISVQKVGEEQIAIESLFPYKGHQGSFDYIVTNNEIRGGNLVNIQRPRTPKKDPYEKVRHLVDKSKIKAPKGMKGSKAAQWINKEYKRQLKKKTGEL